MCFDLIYRNDLLENADVVTDVIVYRGKEEVSKAEAAEAAATCTKMLISNSVVDAVLKEAHRYPSIDLVKGEKVRCEWDRTVVICDPIGLMFLDKESIHPDVVFVADHVKLADKVVLLELKDFSFLAEYSTVFSHPEPPSPVLAKTDIKIRHNVDSVQGITFKLSRLNILSDGDDHDSPQP